MCTVQASKSDWSVEETFKRTCSIWENCTPLWHVSKFRTILLDLIGMDGETEHVEIKEAFVYVPLDASENIWMKRVTVSVSHRPVGKRSSCLNPFVDFDKHRVCCIDACLRQSEKSDFVVL